MFVQFPSSRLAVALVSLCISLALTPRAAAADPGLPPMRVIPVLNYFTDEPAGELLVDIGRLNSQGRLTFDVLHHRGAIARPAQLRANSRAIVAFPLHVLALGTTELVCRLTEGRNVLGEVPVQVTRREPRANEVKINRASGGLVVDGLPFFPVGFYCYTTKDSPQPTLSGEERVKGFNMMSPYQSNSPDVLQARREYMNRCSELGMKVHYQLLKVAGGGGVMGARGEGLSKREQLKAEILEFRDHPALLAWYICDEPTGHRVQPQDLQQVHSLIQELDPYHPVTIVFMRPQSARKYAACMDIVMADPYPIPDHPPAVVATRTSALYKEFHGQMPVWIVPQAFGGSEWWPREPTRQEERLMTYLAVIHGATGIQYFIRHGLNGFPKSTAAWAECGAVALEIAELTPALLSHEPRPSVSVKPADVHVAAWSERGVVSILAANTKKEPLSLRIQLDGLDYSGRAHALFEDRHLPVRNGAIEDMIDAYGTRAYQVIMQPEPAQPVGIDARNLTVNPSFESNPSAGTPAGCYLKVGTGRGATAFVDSRSARHGRHSLRLQVPTADESIALNPFQLQVKAGQRYTFSVWARAEPAPNLQRWQAQPEAGRDGKSLWQRLLGRGGKPDTSEQEPQPVEFEVLLPGIEDMDHPGGDLRRAFPLTDAWKCYTISGVAKSKRKSRILLSVKTAGTAWFDLLQVVPGND